MAIYRCFNEQLPSVGVLGWKVGRHWFLAAWLGLGEDLAAKGKKWVNGEAHTGWGRGNLFLSGFTQQLSYFKAGGLYHERLSDSIVTTQKWIHSLEFVMGKTYPFDPTLHYHTGFLQGNHCERDPPAEPNTSLIHPMGSPTLVHCFLSQLWGFSMLYSCVWR